MNFVLEKLFAVNSAHARGIEWGIALRVFLGPFNRFTPCSPYSTISSSAKDPQGSEHLS